MVVSIITPSFNLQSYIKETYLAIKAQTIADWEWIIVDDASVDRTNDIIRNFHDARIKLIESKLNTGNLSILRNRGVQLASGKYLAFLDGDDICEPERLKQQVDFLEKFPEAGWCHTNVRLLLDETKMLQPRQQRLPNQTIFLADEALRILLRKNYVCISSVMVREKVFKAIGGFDEDFNRCEDIDMWLRLCAQGYSMGYLPQPLLQYRIRQSGLFSSRNLEYLAKNFEVYEKFKKSAPELYARHEPIIRNYLSDNYLKIAIQMTGQKKKGTISHFRNAFMLAPSFKKAVWLLAAVTSPGLIRNYLSKKN